MARLTYAHARHPRFVYVPLVQAERIPPSPFVFLRGIANVADGRAAEVRRRIESHGQDYVVWLKTFDDHLTLALTRMAALVALGVAVTAAWPPAQRAVQLSTTDAIRRL